MGASIESQVPEALPESGIGCESSEHAREGADISDGDEPRGRFAGPEGFADTRQIERDDRQSRCHGLEQRERPDVFFDSTAGEDIHRGKDLWNVRAVTEEVDAVCETEFGDAGAEA